MYTIYNDVEEWEILDQKTIFSYDENPRPIEIIKVQIGELKLYKDIEETVRNFPITRWITSKQYKKFLKQKGAILW